MKKIQVILFFFGIAILSLNGQHKPAKILPEKTTEKTTIKPVFKALPANSLERMKLDFQWIEKDESGHPKRFRCVHPDPLNAASASSFWAARLPGLLDVEGTGKVEFKIHTESTDVKGIIHLKFEQWFQDLPVLDGQYFVHWYPDRNVLAHGRVFLPDEILHAKINEKTARSLAQLHLNSKGLQMDPLNTEFLGPESGSYSASLGYWMNSKTKKWHLVYKLELSTAARGEWAVWVDAVTSEVLKSAAGHCAFHGARNNSEPPINAWNLPNTDAESSEVSSELLDAHHNVLQPLPLKSTMAKDLFDKDRTIYVWDENGLDYLIDASKPMFDPANFNLNNPAGVLWTLNYPGNQITSNNNSWTPAAVSAHYHTALVYDYYLSTHNRNSYDGKGGTIKSYINVLDDFGRKYDGAFWSGGAMYYGTGGGPLGFKPTPRSLDLCAHELSHGVIETTAGLEYDAEPGAINESFADIFAVLVDRDDWTLGEDVVDSQHPNYPSGVDRNLADPNQGLAAGDYDRGWQPKHVQEQYFGPIDAGGVHRNSGIPNHAFYLFIQNMIQGPRQEEDAKKIAEKIYYHALVFYMTRQAVFTDLRAAIEQSCMDLYPGEQDILAAASSAFDAVGILSGGMPGGGVFDIGNTELDPNPGSEFIVYAGNNNAGVFLKDLSSQTLSQLSTKTIISKPSVTDDGSDIYFTANDARVYRLRFNPSSGKYEQTTFLNNPVYRNACISKDGKLLALLKTPADSTLEVIDLRDNSSMTFPLYNPLLRSDMTRSQVNRANSLDFDPSGQYLMYDCQSRNTIKNPYNNIVSNFTQWDIGFIRVWDLAGNQFGDGRIEKLFYVLTNNFNLRNPVFSKNSPDVIAFDFNIGNSYSLVGANIEKGELRYIKQNRTGLGYPSYSVKDDSLLYDGFDAINQPNRLRVVPMASSKVDSSGADRLYMTGGHWGSWFANGTRNLIDFEPLARSDSWSLDEDLSLQADVSQNDLPSANGGNVWDLMGPNGGAVNGTVSMNPDGRFNYVPNANFNGTDSFRYQLCDADGDCSQAEVILSVQPVNDLPFAEVDSVFLLEDEMIAGSVVANDQASGDGGNQWTLNGTNGGALHGQVTMNSDGSFIYTPSANYHGADQFSYKLCDADQDCSSANVLMTIQSVNDLPIAEEDTGILLEDEMLAGSVVANDQASGDGGNQWTLNGTNGGALHGQILMNSDGSFIYTPSANYHGADQFGYKLCDADQDCSSANVQVTIQSVNDLPNAIDDLASTRQNQELTGDVSGNDLASGDGGNRWQLAGPNGGAIGATVSMDAVGSYRYIPNAGFFGMDEFSYTLCDADQDCSTAKVRVNVEQVVGNNEENTSIQIQVLPNPFRDELTLVISGPTVEQVECTIFDGLGKKWNHEPFFTNSNGQHLNIHTRSLNPGFYMLKVRVGRAAYSFKLVKE